MIMLIIPPKGIISLAIKLKWWDLSLTVVTVNILNKSLPALLRHSLSSRGIDFCVIIINVKLLLLMHMVVMFYSSQEKDELLFLFFASETCT